MYDVFGLFHHNLQYFLGEVCVVVEVGELLRTHTDHVEWHRMAGMIVGCPSETALAVYQRKSFLYEPA